MSKNFSLSGLLVCVGVLLGTIVGHWAGGKDYKRGYDAGAREAQVQMDSKAQEMLFVCLEEMVRCADEKK